jgi:hypothetical protein
MTRWTGDASRGPIAHQGAGHLRDDQGVCVLCDADNRRRQAEYRARKRAAGYVLRRGYWEPPKPRTTGQRGE